MDNIDNWLDEILVKYRNGTINPDPKLWATTPELDFNIAKTQILAHIKEIELEARIEAYEHIRLSDNGMQEPLRTWLEKYIAHLKTPQDTKGGEG